MGRGAEEVRATASATGPDRAVRVEQAVPGRAHPIRVGPGANRAKKTGLGPG